MIPEHQHANFETLRRACLNGDLALVETKRKDTGEPAFVICAVSKEMKEGLIDITPLALMFDGSPYDLLEDPVECLEKDRNGRANKPRPRPGGS